MTAPDVSRLAPSDAAVALRTYPRRFRAAVALEEDEPDGVLQRPGADGLSAVDHIDRAGRAISALAGAMREVLTHERPTVSTTPPDPGGATLDAALDRLTLEADALAEAVRHVDTGDWGREGVDSATGQAATALDLLRQAVRSGAVELRAAEEAMATARRTL
ncbi:MAG: hypothetical protein ACRD0G_02140 [Acidimicrobiales bacterium]